MEEKIFKDKTAKVVIIDSSGAVRQLLSEVIKSKGFSTVKSVASVRDAIDIMEVETPDWVITSMLLDEPVNAINLLQLIINQKELKHIKVSLLFDETESRFMTFAFENGMLNFFDKPFNKNSITEKINEFFTQFEQEKWDCTRLSARLILSHLSSKDLMNHKLNFLKKLIGLYPGDLGYLLELAQCHFKLKKFPQSRGLLKQIFALAPEKKADIEAKSLEWFGENILATKAGEEGAEKENLTGLTSCMIVDPDEKSRKIIADLVKDLGIKEIFEFEDGEAAWNHAEEKGMPTLIFHEWKIPKLSGPYLAQRLRYKNPHVLLITLTSLIKPEDLPVIKELGLSALIEKSTEPKEILKHLITVLQENNFPASSVVDSMESKITQFLESGQVQKALALRYNYEKLPANGKNQKTWIDAQFAFVEEKFEMARDLALEAVGRNGNSIAVLNFLGKCLIKLNDFDTALKCLEKAQNLSPKNIERLCMIAEVQTEIGNVKDANQTLAEAKTQDPGSTMVQETEAKIACMTGDTAKAKHIMNDLKSLSKLISYMNNKAVAYARGGKINESFELYKKTLESIPEKKTDMLSTVHYNLGLAYTRINMLDESIKEMDQVLIYGNTKVATKAKSLKNKITLAQKQGKNIALQSDDQYKEAREISSNLQSKIQSSISISPGDVCSYLIFKDLDEPSDEVKGLIAELPHFKSREAIQRSSSETTSTQSKK